MLMCLKIAEWKTVQTLYSVASDLGLHFTKTRPFKYSENFTSKNMKKHMKKYQNFYLKISFFGGKIFDIFE